jgi:hypothetical protein
MDKSHMSKKAAVVLAAIPAIVATEDWHAQAFVAGIVAVAVVAQAVLDWKAHPFPPSPQNMDIQEQT